MTLDFIVINTYRHHDIIWLHYVSFDSEMADKRGSAVRGVSSAIVCNQIHSSPKQQHFFQVDLKCRKTLLHLRSVVGLTPSETMSIFLQSIVCSCDQCLPISVSITESSDTRVSSSSEETAKIRKKGVFIK